MLEITHGDSYRLPLRVKVDDTFVGDESVDEMTISIGNISKTYPGEITYVDGHWHFPLEQAETYQLAPGENRCRIQLNMKNGEPIDSDFGKVTVIKSFSKEVL